MTRMTNDSDDRPAIRPDAVEARRDLSPACRRRLRAFYTPPRGGESESERRRNSRRRCGDASLGTRARRSPSRITRAGSRPSRPGRDSVGSDSARHAGCDNRRLVLGALGFGPHRRFNLKFSAALPGQRSPASIPARAAAASALQVHGPTSVSRSATRAGPTRMSGGS